MEIACTDSDLYFFFNDSLTRGQCTARAKWELHICKAFSVRYS